MNVTKAARDNGSGGTDIILILPVRFRRRGRRRGP